ncbi:MAG: aminotransferase class IV [Nitrospinota bacterium]|jgi:branched-chain amino acid aminotransferase|nr:aminotransferase class IV [Nitrospinota bacterium]
MSGRIAYVNGEFLPESEASISILDRGFLYGDGVYDASRTFNGVPWRMRDHIDRLYLSCRYARLEPAMNADKMEELTYELLSRNEGAYGEGEEFRIQHWVTRGGGISSSPVHTRGAHTVVIFTLPMDYSRFAKGYVDGVSAVVTGVRRIPAECIEPRAKVGNKMNHIQAEFQAAEADAWAIMLDTRGFVAEGPSYNCFLLRDGELLIPQEHNCLTGVNLQYVFELARELNIPVKRGDLTRYDLLTADEAFFTGNSICILPVSSVDGAQMANGAPGPVTRRLMDLWARQVKCDWAEKAVNSLC